MTYSSAAKDFASTVDISLTPWSQVAAAFDAGAASVAPDADPCQVVADVLTNVLGDLDLSGAQTRAILVGLRARGVAK